MSNGNGSYLDFLFFKKINDGTVTRTNGFPALTVPLRTIAMAVTT